MRNLSRLWLLAGIVGCNAVWVGMAGCSGDTIIDAGPDVVADQTTDVPQQDVVVADVKTDVVDGGGGDAPYDASALYQFPAQELAAMCKRFQTCCFGTQDAGSLATCETLANSGFEGSLSEIVNYPGILDAGNLRLDDNAAASCLAGLGTMTCGEVLNLNDGGGTTITASEYAAVTASCYSAIYGSIALGQEGCRASIECVPGSRCVAATAADGGPTTKCTTLEGSGQGPCTVNSNWECQYRGYLGSPALACESDGGGTACMPKLGTGANCTYSFECASGLCNQYANPSCATAASYLDPITCDAVFGTDAGP